LKEEKSFGGTTTVYIFSGSKVIAEYDNGAAVGSPSREYIYAGGALLAKFDSSGTKYYHQDQLSNRLAGGAPAGIRDTFLGGLPFRQKGWALLRAALHSASDFSPSTEITLPLISPLPPFPV
jgi:hypothetical protein